MSPTNGSAAATANSLLPNGVGSAARENPSTNGRIVADEMLELEAAGPPALDQSWRQSSANKPMGKILQRLANSCLKDLRDTINAMAEITIEPQYQQVNGAVPHGVDKSEASVEKKLQLMKFANNQRDRFIKMLVLANWSKREEEMARLVDIKVWQEKEMNAQADAIHRIGLIKRDMFAAKMPNPNIEGALEILSNGSSTRQPHLGYIAPKKLTAKQLLRTLQDMNVILAVRLNTQEDLPFHFNDFQIADGRATFTVPGEFEVDLAVANEDQTSPFYFIDLRFLFSPRGRTLPEGLRAVLEGRSNQALATKGLRGCYDFLHNLVLTHKLNSLRQQALELTRSKWFGCLQIEDWRRVHRIVVTQYWTELPGEKSWVELGVVTGKQQSQTTGQPPNTQLHLNWFRSKQKVLDQSFDIDWVQLDFEKILQIVIAKHMAYNLGQIQEHLITMAGSDSKLAIDCTSSSTTPEDITLRLSLPGQPMPVTVSQQMVTGQITIQPATFAATQAQIRLNTASKREPQHVAQVLAGLLANDMRERIGRVAAALDWRIIALSKQDPRSVLKMFGSNILTSRVYQPLEGWKMPWALAITVGLAGVKWWVVRVEERGDPSSSSMTRILTSARQIHPATGSTDQFLITRDLLLSVEQSAMAEVSYATIARDLTARNVPHKFKRLLPLTGFTSSTSRRSAPMMAIFIPSLSFSPKVRAKQQPLSLLGPIRITHDGVEIVQAEDAESVQIQHEIRLQVAPGQLQFLQKYLLAQKDIARRPKNHDLTMDASGALSLRFSTTFGQPFMDRMQSRMQAIERMDHYLKFLSRHNFICNAMTLTRASFMFPGPSTLGAVISFGKDGNLPVRLKLEPRGDNPLQRIRAMLEQNMSRDVREGIVAFIRIVQTTLPILRAFDKVETSLLKDRAIEIHPRSFSDYSVTFKTPLPSCTYQVTLRARPHNGQSQMLWLISPTASSSALGQNVQQALKDEFSGREGSDWWGMDTSIVARPSAAGDAFSALVETVRRFEGLQDSKSVPQKAPAERSGAPPTSAKRGSPVKQLKQPLKQPAKSNPTAKQSPAKPTQQNARQFNAQARNNVKPKQEVIELD